MYFSFDLGSDSGQNALDRSIINGKIPSWRAQHYDDYTIDENNQHIKYPDTNRNVNGGFYRPTALTEKYSNRENSLRKVSTYCCENGNRIDCRGDYDDHLTKQSQFR